jgi:TPR repeat protein
MVRQSILVLWLADVSSAAHSVQRLFQSWGRRDPAFWRDRPRKLIHYSALLCFVLGFSSIAQSADVDLVGLKLKADSGDAHSQFVVGMFYENGTQGVSKLPGEAVKYYRKSSDAGYAQGHNALAKCYMKGLGVKQDFTEAVRLFKLAAATGLDPAEYELGQMHLVGRLVPCDTPAAVALFTKSAGEFEPRSALALAMLYQNGRGVERDLVKSVKYLHIAAAAPILRAQQMLAYAYQRGLGVEKSDSLALQWYRSASSYGDPTSQMMLGVYCEKGAEGFPPDTIQAWRWYSSAASRGYKEANSAKSRLEKVMTAEQLEEARRHPIDSASTTQKPGQ